MKITVLTVGKIKEKYLRDAIAEYSKRLSRYAKLEIIEVADEKTPDNASETVETNIKNKEAERLLKYIRDDAYLITLEIKGKQLTSEELVPENRYARRAGNEPYYFCDRRFLRAWRGSSEAFELCAQFFKMTFPHQMMRVILLEQIYRSYRINCGEPYHK